MAIAQPFRSVQRVYFDDLDALNILHNVRFLLFMERARGELFQAMGFRWDDDVKDNPDKFHVVASHEIKYLAPVRGEGDIAVDVVIEHLGTTSMILHAKVSDPKSAKMFAEARTRLVRLDQATFRPAPWSDRFRAVVGEVAAR